MLLNDIKAMQHQWLHKPPNEIEVQNLPLPENTKALISQSDKKDQRREVVILITQIQSLLGKPIPVKLKPKFEPLPKLEGCRYLASLNKELNEITRVIFENDTPEWYPRENFLSLGFTSPALEFLARNKVIIQPAEYFDALHNPSKKKSRFQIYSLLEISIYRPWEKWRQNLGKNITVFSKTYLSTGKWTYARFQNELYSGKYNVVDALDVILAHEDETLHEMAILAVTAKAYPYEAPKAYLRKQQENHPSKRTRSYINNILEKNNTQGSDDKIHIENAISCLELKGNRLYNKYKDFVAPPDIEAYFNRIAKNRLWSEIAKHFNLSLPQLFEYWDITSFTPKENNEFYFNFKNYRDLPQDLIDRTYLKINSFIEQGIIKNTPVNNGYYHIMGFIEKKTSYHVKKRLSYNYIFNENCFKNISIEMIHDINDTFIPRFSLKEAIFCLKNIPIVEEHDGKYVYDKVKSQPHSDKFLLRLSKETAQAYLNHLLDSGITEQSSERDDVIISTLRLNILMNSNSKNSQRN